MKDTLLTGKKLLIIGANNETIPLVQKAKSLGVYTIITDNNPYAPAKRHADLEINIDGIHVPELVEFIKENDVNGVLVGVAEALLPSYQEVCEILGFPCYFRKEQIEFLVDKSAFKSACKKFGVKTVPEYDNSKKSFAKIKYPVIVKPVDSCSGKGISVCYSPVELEGGIEKALKFSLRKRFVIEKYMPGPRADVHYLIKDGKPTISCMFDRYESSVGVGLAKLPTAFIFPSRRLGTLISNQDKDFRRLILGMGLYNGPIFFSGFIDESGMLVCTETGHRFTGSQEPLIVEKMTGFSIMEMLIRFAITGETGDGDIEELMNPHFKQWCCKLSPIIKEGRICKIYGLDEISFIPEVFYILQSYFEGDSVFGEGTLKQLFARFFIFTDTIDKMSEVINKIQSNLSVLDENGDSMIIQTFDTKLLDIYR
jgi:biotin carboxylase